jgi:hypothetical protein
MSYLTFELLPLFFAAHHCRDLRGTNLCETFLLLAKLTNSHRHKIWPEHVQLSAALTRILDLLLEILQSTEV